MMSECHKLVCISHPRIKSDREDCKRTLPEQNMQCSWPMERKKRGRSGGPFIKVTFLGHESNKELSGRFQFSGGREGSVFPDGANMRSRSVTDCCQVRISRFHRLFDRDQTEEEEGQNDARRGEERTELSIPPSIDHIQRGCQCQ